MVFDIQKFSLHDGPGIRTTVFLKGCPLECVWCHNPESQGFEPELSILMHKCIGCGACADVCKRSSHEMHTEGHRFNATNCVKCRRCVDVCPVGAIELIGDVMTAEDVLRQVLQDKVFYETSGGGLTLSGGEPMAQFDFSFELLTMAADAGIHRCMETCGHGSWDKYKKIAPLVDTFLFDYKATPAERHKELTGVSSKIILANLRGLNELGASVILRCPLVPSVNDTDEHLGEIAHLASSLECVSEVHLLPYHPLGESKRNGTAAAESRIFKDPTDAQKQYWLDRISASCTKNVKYY